MQERDDLTDNRTKIIKELKVINLMVLFSRKKSHKAILITQNYKKLIKS